MIATGRRSRSGGLARRCALAAAAVLTAASLAPATIAATPAAVVADISGIFVDGWYPVTPGARRPVSVTSGLEVSSDARNVQVMATSTSELGAGLVDIIVNSGSSDPLVVGPAKPLLVSTGGGGCESPWTLPSAGTADVLELERAADGTVNRFAVSINMVCYGPFSGSATLHAEVRYHSTIGYAAVAFSPMPVPNDPNAGAGTILFGDVPVGTAATPRTETVTNAGTLPLAVGATSTGDPDITVDTDACRNRTLAPGESCAISVAFSPTSVGGHGATITLLTPDLDPTISRTMLVGGTGTAPAQVTLAPIGSPPTDMSLDGMYWFSLGVEPKAAFGGFDLYATCQVSGNGVHGALGDSINPQLIWMDLPPGPCSASVHFSGTGGWGSSDAGPVEFTVPSFSAMYLTTTTGDDTLPQSHSPAGVPVTITAHVTGTNGATPTGGTVTITDTDTNAVLGSGELAPDLTFSVVTPPLDAGTHNYLAVYSGDGSVVGTNEATKAFVDGDAPVGEAVIDNGIPAIATPAVTLGLTATDASTSVTNVRVSNTPVVSGGLLVGGTTSAQASTLPWTLPGADGRKTVYVQWRDAVGNWSAPTSASVLLDRTAPTVSMPKVSLGAAGTAIDAASAPIVVTWTGLDGGSGIKSYDVRESIDGGTAKVISSGLTVTHLAVTAAPGHTYRFDVRARDKAGNASPWAKSAVVRLTGLQQTAGAVHLAGSWSTSTGASWWGGSAKSSTRFGSTASVTFTGRQVAWVGLRSTTRGKAQVYVDGILAATVDLRASVLQPERLVWRRTWSVAGTHTVVIRVLATSGRPRVDVDGFLVLR